MGKYEVGQILYLTNEKTFKIIPVQVVEEVTRTTISGVYKTYHIQFPDKKNTVVDIADIKYKCFKTAKEVKDYLLNNTRNAIDELLNAANQLKAECFSHQPAEKEPASVMESFTEESVVHPVVEDDIIKIDLGNGRVGKMNKKELGNIGKE